jgi:hypothetical protein
MIDKVVCPDDADSGDVVDIPCGEVRTKDAVLEIRV